MSDDTDYLFTLEVLADVASQADAHGAAGVLEDLDRVQLAETLDMLDRVRAVLNGLASETARLLASLMEQDREEIGRFVVKRSRSTSEQWDAESARRDALVAIRNRLAVNPETGEIVPSLSRVVEEAVRTAYAVTSTAPKAKLLTGGLKALGLRPDDYRSVEPSGPWRIEMVETFDVGGPDE